MPWLVLHIACDAALGDAVEDQLLTSGAAAVTLQDGAGQALFQVLPGEAPLWDQLTVSGLFDAATDMEAVIAGLRTRDALATCRHRLEILEDKDWVRSWMDSYQPIAIGERLWICPSWLEPSRPEAVNLLLDPGQAFGTGTHPTTAMCLRWLEACDLGGLRLIDYGCGSGILAIAGLLLGASHAVATDIDPVALEATRDNARQNGIASERLQLCLPAQLAPDCAADIVLANILAGPLASLAPALTRLVRPGGALVLSGILREQAAEVMAAYPEFTFEPAQVEDEWVLLAALRNSDRLLADGEPAKS